MDGKRMDWSFLKWTTTYILILIFLNSVIVVSGQPSPFAQNESSSNNIDNNIIISYEDHIEIINGTDMTVIESFSLSPTINYIVGVTTDGLDSNMFLSDLKDTGTTIFKVSLNSHHKIRPIVKKNSLELVQGVAYDRLENYLYYSDTIKKRILKSLVRNDENGDDISDPKDVIIFDKDDKLHGVAVDSCERKLYWVNWNKEDPKIERSNLDGSERVILFNSSLSKPYSLIIDDWERRLYWIDVDSNSDSFKIERSSLDNYNSTRETLCWGTGNSPYSMTVSKELVYWSDWQNSVIWRISKDGGDCIPKAVKRLTSKRPMGISTLSVPNSCEPIISTPISYVSMTERSATIPTLVDKTETPILPEEESCTNYCIHGLCSLTSIKIPICTCEAGYAGSRCQNDLCHNYCLNGGICQLDDETTISPLQKCLCHSPYEGKRCEIIKENFEVLLSKENIYFYLLVTMSLISTALVILLMTILMINRRLKKTSQNIPQPSTDSFDQSPEIILPKRKRLISGPKAKKNRQNNSCSVELEDCCQMTICDTPCVEVASQRKARRRGISENYGNDDDKSVLLDNDHLKLSYCSSIINNNEDLF